MRFLGLLLAGLMLAPSNALFIPAKRQTSDYVKDGGFELVPKSDNGRFNFNGGSWTFTGTATMYRGQESTYGKQFAHIADQTGAASSGSITQQISGLPVGTLLTLTYKMRQGMPPYAAICNFRISFGSKTIQAYKIVSESHGQINWSTNAKAFKAPASSGALTFYLSCGREPGEGYDIMFDNISITA